MKKLIVLLILVCGTGAASPIYSYVFDTSDIEECLGVTENFWVCDDFTTVDKTPLGSVIFYAVDYIGEFPTALDLKISWDYNFTNDPNGNYIIWEDLLLCQSEFVCYYFGYPVYKLTCDFLFENLPQVLAAQHYYVHLRFPSEGCCYFRATHKNGSPAWGGTQTQYWLLPEPRDLFMVIDDEPLSLQPATWADIKTTFSE